MSVGDGKVIVKPAVQFKNRSDTSVNRPSFPGLFVMSNNTKEKHFNGMLNNKSSPAQVVCT